MIFHVVAGCGAGGIDGSSSALEATNCWKISANGEICLQEGREVAESEWKVNIGFQKVLIRNIIPINFKNYFKDLHVCNQ